MTTDDQTRVKNEETTTAGIRRYVHLLSYAIIGEDTQGRPTVILCDESGKSKHTDDEIPITFKETSPLPADRIFNTTLFDKATQKPFHIINLLAEFEKEWFEKHQSNIPSFKELIWDDLKESGSELGMRPIAEP